MYGTLVTEVDVFDMKVQEGQRKAQEGRRFGYAKGVKGQAAHVILARAVAFFRKAMRLEGASAPSAGESLSSRRPA